MRSTHARLLAVALFALLIAFAQRGGAEFGGAEVSDAEDDRQQRAMTQERMERILSALGSEVRGGAGMLEFVFDGVPMACISDVRHGRMRLVAAVRPVSEVTAEQVASVLEANFHTALDARYATSNGVLYAAFIHPLGPLSEEQLRSAVRQVAGLTRSFGSTYSSGELVFGAESREL